MLDFRTDTFLTVCKYMNFTRAAERLGLTQSAVSQQIRYLENAYGVKFFRQEGKRIRLTEEGEIFRQAILRIKNDEEHLRSRMGSVGAVRRYVFGATLTAAEYILPARMKNFIQNAPVCQITMYVENTKKLLQMLEEGTVDFAVVEGNFSRREYASLQLSKESFVVCGDQRKAERYRGKKLHDLLPETLLLREQGSGSREILEQELQKEGMSVQDFGGNIELANIGAIKYLVKEGTGLTFLYEAAVRREIESGELYRIELQDFVVEHDIRFIYRKGSIFASDYEEIFHRFSGK